MVRRGWPGKTQIGPYRVLAGRGRLAGVKDVPSAGLPKDGNGPDQGFYVGTLVVEASFQLLVTGGRST